MPDSSSLWKKLADWVERVLPTAATVGAAVYQWMNGKTKKLEQDKRDVELQLQYEKNKNAIHEKYRGKSDTDIIQSAIDGQPKPD